MMTLEESGLSPELYEATKRDIIKKGRQEYSDADLWEWLLELYCREIEILKQVHVVCRLGFSGSNDYKFWRSYWDRLCVELRGIVEMMELIVWHLTMRGDTAIAYWVVEAEEFKRQGNKQWLREAYWSVNSE